MQLRVTLNSMRYIYAGNDSNNILKLSTLTFSLAIYLSFCSPPHLPILRRTVCLFEMREEKRKTLILVVRLLVKVFYFFISKLFVAFDQYFRSLFSFLRQLFFPIGNRKLNKHKPSRYCTTDKLRI